MTEEKLVKRAVRILLENRYLTMATCSEGAAWATPLNYVLGPGPYLHFYSTPTARHSRDVEQTPRVACAVFDSTAQGDDVDGMQFIATCTVLAPSEVATVSEFYFENNFQDPEVRDWWYRPPSAFFGDGAWRFYRLEVDEMYLIDLESFEDTKVDGRIRVDVPTVFSALKDLQI